MYTIGIDSGSTTTKGILLKDYKIVKKIIVPTGANPKRAIKSVYESLIDKNHIYTITTGYGRNLLVEKDKAITEITCHGKGVNFLEGDIRVVIDIGGQDSKVIILDEKNNISDFLMNDKCAAGTGRFMEVIMRILHQDLDDLDEFVKGIKPVKISSMCAVFAESEVISLLADDIPGNEIAKGVINSICERTAIFARRLPLENKVFLSGGLSKSIEIRETLEKHLGLKIVTHELAQYAGAIGAAVIGMNKKMI